MAKDNDDNVRSKEQEYLTQDDNYAELFEDIKPDGAKKEPSLIKGKASYVPAKKSVQIALVITKSILVLIIIAFIASLFSPWYVLGGSTTYKGFVEIPKRIATKSFIDAVEYKDTEYEGDIVQLSPMDLVGYSLKHYSDYKYTLNSERNQHLSEFSIIHTVVILTHCFILLFAAISILIVLFQTGIRRIRAVKILSVISTIIIGLNYLWLKVTYINMFVIRAKAEIRSQDLLSGVSTTMQGIVVNRTFYSYSFYTNNTFVYALIFIGGWLVISSILTEIERKWKEEREELMNKMSAID